MLFLCYLYFKERHSMRKDYIYFKNLNINHSYIILCGHKMA